ncbi:hypothetical protein AB1Y20_015967 [Prymnesium parvum]|uniref:Calpain catalytic domain-containing protein n=1 Tax=Prymnesium parvum TaxID=97485 RepID=A0AB34JZF6_PRYPA
MTASVEGAWTRDLSGGCPKNESTWHQNPQFQLFPSAEGATYVLELRQYNLPPSLLTIGMWVMKADDLQGRKRHIVSADTVGKTKFKADERRVLELQLPPREGGLPYIVICSTYEPGQLGRFTLKVTSPEDERVTLVPLQPPPAPEAVSLGSLKASGSLRASRKHMPLGSFNPPGVSGRGGMPYTAAQSTSAAPAGPPPPSNEPVIEIEGQGLSTKLQAELAAAIEAAVQQCSSTGGLYEDAQFPPEASSLSTSTDWAPGSLVVSWRRPSEIAPSGEPKLFKSSWQTGSVHPGRIGDGWLCEALNVISGDMEVCEQIFVDVSHGDKGFYAVRLFEDDPNSDDDWHVVLVDDRLPCGEDGLPCFGRCEEPDVFWMCIIEKAIAKHYGSYAGMEGPKGSRGEAQALELLTGGRAAHPASPLLGGDAGELWEKLMEAQRTKYVVGVRCPANSAAAGKATEMGLVPGRTYCLVSAGDVIGGKLMKLRGFYSDPEWKGKWSDHDSAWTNQMRQMLNYQDVKDGSFWINFDDFNKYFSELDFVRMADDRWTRLTVKSRWMDETAGGGPAYITWRNNYQWLLHISRPTRITFQLTAVSSKGSKLANHALGLVVARGNIDEDSKRRKLLLRDTSEIVLNVDPAFSRRISAETLLEPSHTPYVVVPYLQGPGEESAFSLVLLSDDRDDDGKLDFSFEPVRPAPHGDWHILTSRNYWAHSTRIPGEIGFDENPQLRFRFSGPQGAKAHVFIFVETIGVQTDMRLQAGVQSSPRYPAVGLVLVPSAAEGERFQHLPPKAVHATPQARDGIWLEAHLDVGDVSHLVIPYLGAGGIRGCGSRESRFE